MQLLQQEHIQHIGSRNKDYLGANILGHTKIIITLMIWAYGSQSQCECTGCLPQRLVDQPFEVYLQVVHLYLPIIIVLCFVISTRYSTRYFPRVQRYLVTSGSLY
jgi:hypothetical protein